jgi:hypothetical protein
VTGGWRKLHNEKLHNLYSSPYIIRIKSRRMRWAGHVTCMQEMRNTYKIVGKAEGTRSHGICRHRWKEKIKMDLSERRLEGVDWIYLAQDRDRWWAFVNRLMNRWFP